MKTPLQMKMYYAREYTPTFRFFNIYSWSVFSITELEVRHTQKRGRHSCIFLFFKHINNWEFE